MVGYLRHNLNNVSGNRMAGIQIVTVIILWFQKEDLANAVNAGASANQQMVLDEDD